MKGTSDRFVPWGVAVGLPMLTLLGFMRFAEYAASLAVFANVFQQHAKQVTLR